MRPKVGKNLWYGVRLSMLLALLIGVLTPMSGAPAPISLPRYNVDRTQTSLSGLSAGGYMAVQMQIAHSSIIKGAGIFAAGPYQCSEGDLQTALSRCMSPGVGNPAPSSADIARFADRTRSRAAAGVLDDPANLARQKVWIFSGKNDQIVVADVVKALALYYAKFIPANQISSFDEPGKQFNTYHNWVVVDGDRRVNRHCEHINEFTSHDSYINDCDYDAAGALLQYIYGPLRARNAGILSGAFIEFNQGEFVVNPGSKSLADSGWIYVPSNCASGAACRLHVAFHGCYQYYGHVGDAFIKNTGLNQWADTNSFIILYPQATSTGNFVDWFDFFHRLWGIPNNPRGCFDWWGYNDSGSAQSKTYDTKSGAQIVAIKAMIDRITQHPALP